jgi:hypothetical protein
MGANYQIAVHYQIVLNYSTFTNYPNILPFYSVPQVRILRKLVKDYQMVYRNYQIRRRHDIGCPAQTLQNTRVQIHVRPERKVSHASTPRPERTRAATLGLALLVNCPSCSQVASSREQLCPSKGHIIIFRTYARKFPKYSLVGLVRTS